MKEKNLSQVPKSGVTKREIMIIAIVVGGAFIAILNQTVLSPALPKLMETFQINAGTAQWGDNHLYACQWDYGAGYRLFN